MKINDIDWSKVPDILAKEQVRLLCHCSKRTALYYLKSGKLPCIYSGKKTRCYKIRKEDLMAFIEDRENHPEFYAVPEGWYKESGRTVRQHYSSEIKINGEDLHEYYRFLLKEYPDVLEVKKVSEITGYGGHTCEPVRDNLPEQCYSVLSGSDEIIIIKRGEKGYFKADIPVTDKDEARSIVNEYNTKLGVSKAQEEAMKAGSMFGFQVPAADPRNYDADGKPVMPKDRGDAR